MEKHVLACLEEARNDAMDHILMLLVSRCAVQLALLCMLSTVCIDT